LEPLPYEAPEEIIPEELEVQGDVDDSTIQLDDDGQITLSLD
jgi:topoisomerase-4 subunit A